MSMADRDGVIWYDGEPVSYTHLRHFRRVDDRREAGAADVAETGDGEAGALHGIGRELLVAGLVGQVGGLGGQLQEALPVDIADHRDQPVSYTHLDVYKRQVKGRLRFFSKEFQGFRVVRASARGLAGVAARQRQPGVHART